MIEILLIVGLSGALCYSLAELLSARAKLRRIERSAKELERELMALMPAHPNCRCLPLPAPPIGKVTACTRDVLLEGLGIEHRCQPDGSIIVNKIHAIDACKDLKEHFESLEMPNHPDLLMLRRRESRNNGEFELGPFWRWASDGVLEALDIRDDAFIRRAEGAIFKSTFMPSGAVTPPYEMVATRGYLKKRRKAN